MLPLDPFSLLRLPTTRRHIKMPMLPEEPPIYFRYSYTFGD